MDLVGAALRLNGDKPMQGACMRKSIAHICAIIWLAACSAESAVTIEDVHGHGFCTSYARGLMQAIFSRDDGIHDAEIERSLGHLLSEGSAKKYLTKQTADAWWDGYFAGDVHFRSKLGDRSTDRATVTTTQINQAAEDFLSMCEGYLDR